MSSALVVVDVQNHFCPGESLAVKDGHEVVEGINAIRDSSEFSHVVFTRDWHPQDHVSFARNHPNQPEFSTKLVNGLPQTLWPVHCEEGTVGAGFHEDLDVRDSDFIYSKGTSRDWEEYSAFGNSAMGEFTTFAEELRSRGISKLYVCGLAADYCVCETAIDGANQGFSVVLLEDLTVSTCTWEKFFNVATIIVLRRTELDLRHCASYRGGLLRIPPTRPKLECVARGLRSKPLISLPRSYCGGGPPGQFFV